MSTYLAPVPTLSEAWVAALETVAATPAGRAVHVITTVTQPGDECEGVRAVLDGFLASSDDHQLVDTVAETIFPAPLYRDPGFLWRPELSAVGEGPLDAAARDLYETYSDMLPLLLTANGNSRGTYFSRMITWPGLTASGVNQLDARIRALRACHRSGQRTSNVHDIDLGADSLVRPKSAADIRGLQLYKADDSRVRGFPCLTHVDLTLFAGVLHAVAIYRHHYLVEKAYGNYVGLARLLKFLAQQSGFRTGELVVHATLADAQLPTFRRQRVHELARQGRAALSTVSNTGAAVRVRTRAAVVNG